MHAVMQEHGCLVHPVDRLHALKEEEKRCIIFMSIVPFPCFVTVLFDLLLLLRFKENIMRSFSSCSFILVSR
jgi:hypothetical protein